MKVMLEPNQKIRTNINIIPSSPLPNKQTMQEQQQLGILPRGILPPLEVYEVDENVNEFGFPLGSMELSCRGTFY